MSKKKPNRNSKQIEKKKQKKLAASQKEEALKVAVSEVSGAIETTNDCPGGLSVCEAVSDTEQVNASKTDETENLAEAEKNAYDISTENTDSGVGENDDENTASQSPQGPMEKGEPDKGFLFRIKNIPWKDYADFVNEKLDDIWNFISETRKISVPLIILLYTAVVVAITIPIEHARVLNQIHREANVIEEIRTPENTSGSIEKDIELVLSTGSKVVYRGYEFTNTVKGANSDDFGSTYEMPVRSIHILT